MLMLMVVVVVVLVLLVVVTSVRFFLSDPTIHVCDLLCPRVKAISIGSQLSRHVSAGGL